MKTWKLYHCPGASQASDRLGLTRTWERAKQAIDQDLDFYTAWERAKQAIHQDLQFLMANFWMKRWPSPWTPHTNRGQVRAQGLDTLQRRSTALDANKDLHQGGNGPNGLKMPAWETSSTRTF